MRRQLASMLLCFNRFRFLVVAIYAAIMLPAHGSEPPYRLLEEVIANRGDRVIKTGEFRYALNILDAPPPKEVSDARVEEVRAILREKLEKYAGNAKMRQRYEKAIESVDQYIPEQLRQNTNRTMQYYYALGGPALGGDRYYEFSVLDSETKRPGASVFFVERSLGSGKGVSLRVDGRDRMAFASHANVSAGSQEPQRLGRANGILAALAVAHEAGTPLQDMVTEPQVQQVENESEVTFQLADPAGVSTPEGTVISLKLRVDSDRGYVLPLIQELGVDGQIVHEWQSSEFFQPRDAGIWFPAVCTFQAFSASDLKPRFERYDFVPDSVILNHSIPDERFHIIIESNMVLVDTRDVAQAQYVAKRNLNLSLDELDDLGSIVGLTAYAPRTVPIRNSTTLNALPRMTSLIVINLIVLALLLGVIVFRRRFRGKPPMVVLAACLATGTGCIRSTTENANNEKQIQLEVTPAAVELGELATDCGTIPFSLNVENLSDCDVKVNVLPSCGCTNVDKTSFTLHSKASHKVSLNIAARGRSGMFKSSVRLVSYGTDPPSKSLELSVPISCVFRDDRDAPFLIIPVLLRE
jgi:hypothetical protein